MRYSSKQNSPIFEERNPKSWGYPGTLLNSDLHPTLVSQKERKWREGAHYKDKRKHTHQLPGKAELRIRWGLPNKPPKKLKKTIKNFQNHLWNKRKKAFYPISGRRWDSNRCQREKAKPTLLFGFDRRWSKLARAEHTLFKENCNQDGERKEPF